MIESLVDFTTPLLGMIVTKVIQTIKRVLSNY